MDINLIINQNLTIGLLILIGYILFRKAYITKTTVDELTWMLLKVITPIIVFTNMISSVDRISTLDLLSLVVLSLIIVFFGYIVTRILRIKDKVIQFGLIFSNSGFMGIPLVTAIIGSEYVVYIIPFMIAQNLLMWTLGIGIMDRDSCFEIRAFLRNPVLVSFLLGLIIRQVNPQLPKFLLEGLNYMATMNTPLAMIVLGTFLPSFDRELLEELKLYLFPVVLKLLVIPLLSIFILNAIGFIDLKARMALLLVIACPTASACAMFSSMYKRDFQKAAVFVSVTTILSIVSIPLILMLGELLLKV